MALRIPSWQELRWHQQAAEAEEKLKKAQFEKDMLSVKAMDREMHAALGMAIHGSYGNGKSDVLSDYSGDTTEYRKQQARLLLAGQTTIEKANAAIRDIETQYVFDIQTDRYIKRTVSADRIIPVVNERDGAGNLHSRLQSEISSWCGGILNK